MVKYWPGLNKVLSTRLVLENWLAVSRMDWHRPWVEMLNYCSVNSDVSGQTLSCTVSHWTLNIASSPRFSLLDLLNSIPSPFFNRYSGINCNLGTEYRNLLYLLRMFYYSKKKWILGSEESKALWELPGIRNHKSPKKNSLVTNPAGRRMELQAPGVLVFLSDYVNGHLIF